MKKIGIIIVNYKDYAQKFLEDCVKSLRAQRCSDFLFKIYIIDNCFTDESIAYLKEKAPEAEVILRSDGNYSAANRAGVKQALEDGCSHVVIANMDVVFANHWLRELLETADSSLEIGIAQSKIMLWSEREKINSAGNVLHFLGFGFTRGYQEIDEGQYNSIGEISGYASGSSFIIKREVLEKIGNYDAEYYMYHDDLEMGWRARLAGYKITLSPNSVVYHKYEFSRSIKMLYYMERNRYIAVFSFYKLPTLLLVLPPLLAMDIGMLGYSIANKWFLIKLKVYLYFLNPFSWAHIYRARRSVKKYRKISDREIAKNISGKVEFQEIMNPVLKRVVNPAFDLYWNIVRKFIWW
ncbi:hypothetical protein COT99_01980 [Candidatus Falkowbacteria bacterium CG10_big_fil_rev_8_21_14_0_10_43_10]|uniref:Glycosyltransferase 2-like domain-containing protein n=1 Tax=Candidatus Falkowbacteria bacterium CG10_big_fil_rev_8_21_14_0_10_43_10 TaxID=1974567 RepID=A0A2H0V439_9BACT|nr:MAG: hypothetical protein COT99_01980 [Candidatus Falkowbacteria bacterium CG10_big_fil_rev_8_21_14_0_10_43_10]